MIQVRKNLPALLLTVIVAAALALTMGMSAQKAYAAENEDYTVTIEAQDNVWTALPGQSVTVKANVKYEGWGIPASQYNFDWSLDSEEFATIAPGEDPSTAVVSFKDIPADWDPAEEESFWEMVGVNLTVSDENMQPLVTAIEYVFVSESFDIIYDGEAPLYFKNNCMDIGDSLSVDLSVHHFDLENASGVPVEGVTFTCDQEGSIKTEGENGKFTFTRTDAGEGEAVLYADWEEGSLVEWFMLDEIATDLGEYDMVFDGSEYDIQYYLDEDNPGIGADSISISNENGTYVVPADKYELKVQKFMGFKQDDESDESTDEPVFVDSDFPLTFDEKGATDLNGNPTEGTALYLVTATPAEGSGFTGQVEGVINVYSKMSITPYAGAADMDYKYIKFINEEPFWRYEVTPGTDPGLTVYTSDYEKPLEKDKDYSVKYVNILTEEEYTDVTTLPAGTYTCVVTGIDPYYGTNDMNQLKVGTENKAFKATAKKKTLKVKKLKKKAQKFVPIKVKNAKGDVSYELQGGNKKSMKALKFNEQTGKVTVKKKTKKGTYKISVLVTDNGNDEYLQAQKQVNITVKVK